MWKQDIPNMPKLTKRVIDAAKPDPEGHYFIWDEEMPGFGIRILKSGRKTFQIQYRKGGRSRRNSIGMYGTVTPDQARKHAKELLGRVAKGENPAEERAIHQGAATVADVCERFISEYVPIHCKESTAKEYRRSVDLFIKPAFGTRKVPDIIRSDIAKLHHDLREKPYQANRTLGVLSVLFNQCEIWGLRPDGSNPCRHVKKYTEKKRERFLSKEELKRLWGTLEKCERDGSESTSACNCFRLLILTGCRLGEIQSLKWEYIREDGICLPDSKTGAKKIYAGKEVHELLATINPRESNPYVIVGKTKGHHLTDLQRPWRRIREKANLCDLRIHDLRHSYASFGLANGLSLAEIGKLLGHSQIQTTARYAHMADKIAAEAAEKVSLGISIITSGKDEF
jgi:integrase